MTEIIKLTANSKVVKEKSFSRATEYDFHDDGSDFKGWVWQDKLPLTQLYSDGKLYLCVRADYIFGSLEIPHSFYSKYVTFDKVYKYNGTAGKVDLDDLVSICEETWTGIQKAKEDFANLIFPDLSDKVERIEASIEEAEDIVLRNINWFELNLSDDGIKEAYRLYRHVKYGLSKDYEDLEAIKNKTFPMNEAIDLKNRSTYVARTVYVLRQLKELINGTSYDWYYIEKKSGMK